MTGVIDLNCDLGEDESAGGIERDLAIMDIVSSCNIACGGHAGSPETMHRMLHAARQNKVSAGAHPSYPDRTGFGRVTMNISLTDLHQNLLTQLADIKTVAQKTSVSLTHLKPHGALYNDAQDNENLSSLIVDIALRENLPLVGMANSRLQRTAQKNNIRFISEGFIDRRYTPTQRLQPRSEAGAVIADKSQRLSQALALASGKSIVANDGKAIMVHADTLCLHSDSAGALESARNLRVVLENSGFTIAACSR